MSGIAIFDLDRTLTKRGCFTSFIFYAARSRPRRFLSLPHIFFAVIANALGFYERDNVKLLMWRKVVGGLHHKDAEDMGKTFVQTWIQKELRSKTHAIIKKHREAGDRLILATAAIDIIADPFGQRLGFDEIICTRTCRTADNRVSGNFDGKNCYGEEKLRRVQLATRDFTFLQSSAYSDHITDLPLLLWAKNGVAVNPHRPLLDAAGRHGLRIEDWD